MPSSSGISTSSVTICGSSASICFSASSPLRAVPMTRNSGEASMICVMTRRMNALSSTTRTVDAGLDDTVAFLQRPHFDAAIIEMKVDAPSVVETRILGEERDVRRRQHVLRGVDVPLAHVDAGAAGELPEHAGAADDLGADRRRGRRA